MGTIVLVVPAKAGTHSPRIPLLKQSRRPVFSNNIRRGVWVPALRRDDVGREYAFAISRHGLPELCKFVGPLENRGRRESRVPTAPAVSCAELHIVGAHEHTGSAETARPSPRNGFTAYFELSPVSGLFCHRHP